METTVTKLNEQLVNGGREKDKRSYVDNYARLESWVAGASANELNNIESTLYLDNNSNSSSDDDDNDNNDDDEDNDAPPKDERELIDINETNHNSNEEDYQDEYYYNNNYYDQHYYRSKGTDTDDLY